jgi:X-Pro dipeptidyl-peptidase
MKHTSEQLYSSPSNRLKRSTVRGVWCTSVAACWLAALVVAGLGSYTQAQEAALAVEGLEVVDAKPVFENGEAQVVEAFSDPKKWIRHDLWVETEFDSDQNNKLDRVHVAVTRPAQTEHGLKLPVVYETSPYYAGTASNSKDFFWNTEHDIGAEPPERTPFPPIELKTNRPIISASQVRDWVPRGYIVVHSSSPGTGLSEGCPTVGGANETLAPKAVIDWLCGRAKGYTTVDGDEEVTAFWSTGKVGMTGTSYNGTLPLAAATTGVEGLEAIIPVAPNTSYYHYYRSNGLVRHPYGYMGEDIDVLYDFIHSAADDERRKYCDCEIRDNEMLTQLDRVTGDYNDFWAGRDYLNHLEPLKAPVLMAHAFNDWNVVPEHSYRIIKALKEKGVPVQVYYHQGGHGGPPPMKMMNRWFTRYLHGIENDVEKDPKSWIVREGKEQSDPTPYDDYPHPNAKPVPVHLVGGAPGVGQLSLVAPADEGSSRVETVVDDSSIFGRDLAKAEESPHRLLFVTPTLKKPVHISGVPTIKIRVASDKPAVNLSVWLVSLPWQGGAKAKITDNLITRGWADPQNSRSLTESEPLVPGEFVDLSFELQPDDQIIPAGQQIGLMIFASDRDFTLLPPPGTELSVDLAGTQLILPIVGGDAAFAAAFE